MERWHLMIIDPVKALTNLFLTIFPAFCYPTKLYLKILLQVRHYPSIFDSYLSFINKYGFVIPVTGQLKEKMPTVFGLLCLNTYSKDNMEKYLKKHYDDRKLPDKYRKFFFKSMFWERSGWTSDDHQMTNVPMAMAIIIKLLKAYYLPADDLEHFQMIQFNYSSYKDLFQKYGKIGLMEDTPINEEISPRFHSHYREVINLCFAPLQSMMTKTTFTYSMEEVLMALLYDSTPKYVGPQKQKPPFKFSDDDYTKINTYLMKYFFVEEDYYYTMERGADLIFAKDAEKKKPKKEEEGNRRGRSERSDSRRCDSRDFSSRSC